MPPHLVPYRQRRLFKATGPTPTARPDSTPPAPSQRGTEQPDPYDYNQCRTANPPFPIRTAMAFSLTSILPLPDMLALGWFFLCWVGYWC